MGGVFELVNLPMLKTTLELQDELEYVLLCSPVMHYWNGGTSKQNPSSLT